MADEIINLGSWLLAALAAINWGTVELFDTNLLTDTAALPAETASIAYIVIGIAGVVNLYLLAEEVL
jgi:uncharacterized membrane protein YuzA (DUF378 family)